MNFCSICTEKIDTGTTNCSVCNAKFHSTCLNTWMKHGKGCPNCRYCVQNELLMEMIPDIPSQVCNSLTSFETYNLCKTVIMLKIFKGLSENENYQD